MFNGILNVSVQWKNINKNEQNKLIYPSEKIVDLTGFWRIKQNPNKNLFFSVKINNSKHFIIWLLVIEAHLVCLLFCFLVFGCWK